MIKLPVPSGVAGWFPRSHGKRRLNYASEMLA
jgi:hypothetical protein